MRLGEAKLIGRLDMKCGKKLPGFENGGQKVLGFS